MHSKYKKKKKKRRALIINISEGKKGKDKL